MKKTINIIAVKETGSCGSGEPHQHGTKPGMAAGIDTDIFEADDLTLEGERFWESFWQTQYTYGGIHEEQPLANVFSALDNDLFDKLHQDVMLVGSDSGKLDDATQNDIWGMMIFLLCLEKGDSQYDPIEEDGIEGTLSRFSSVVNAEYQRRANLSQSGNE